MRDGKTESLPVSKLVPGDVIHLRGGALTPADVEWLEAPGVPWAKMEGKGMTSVPKGPWF